MAAAQFLDVGGRRTRVRLAGDSATPPVVLLHGIGRSLEDFGPQYGRLSAAHRLIGMDLPGFGYSTRLPEPASLRSLAGGVLETIEAVGEARPVHLVGNSLGGAVSLQVLAAAPERVASVTLVASAGFGPEVSYLLRALAVPGLGSMMLRKPTRLSAWHIERHLFADSGFVTPERVAFALRLARRREVADFLAELAHGLGTARGVKAEWRAELLAAATRHQRPTLIVWGDADRILPVRHLASARAAFPHARAHLFPDTGHMPQIERADAFAALFQDFLAAQPAIAA